MSIAQDVRRAKREAENWLDAEEFVRWLGDNRAGQVMPRLGFAVFTADDYVAFFGKGRKVPTVMRGFERWKKRWATQAGFLVKWGGLDPRARDDLESAVHHLGAARTSDIYVVPLEGLRAGVERALARSEELQAATAHLRKAKKTKPATKGKLPSHLERLPAELVRPRLLEIREYLGLSNERMAELIGVSKVMVKSWLSEKPSRAPKTIPAFALASAEGLLDTQIARTSHMTKLQRLSREDVLAALKEGGTITGTARILGISREALRTVANDLGVRLRGERMPAAEARARLRAVRDHLKLSDGYYAELLGTSRSNLSTWLGTGGQWRKVRTIPTAAVERAEGLLETMTPRVFQEARYQKITREEVERALEEGGGQLKASAKALGVGPEGLRRLAESRGVEIPVAVIGRVTKRQLEALLKKHEGDRTRMARELGVTPTYVRTLLKKTGLFTSRASQAIDAEKITRILTDAIKSGTPPNVAAKEAGFFRGSVLQRAAARYGLGHLYEEAKAKGKRRPRKDKGAKRVKKNPPQRLAPRQLHGYRWIRNVDEGDVHREAGEAGLVPGPPAGRSPGGFTQSLHWHPDYQGKAGLWKAQSNPGPKFLVRSPAQGLRTIKHEDITANYEKALRWKPRHRKAVLVPCAQTKPFPDAPSHRGGYLAALEGKDVDVWVVSEPLGVVPYAWSRDYPNADYDFPPEHLRGAAHDLLAKRIATWLKRVGSKYSKLTLALPAHHMKLVNKALGQLKRPPTKIVRAGIGACLDSGACPTGHYRATSKAYRRFLKARANPPPSGVSPEAVAAAKEHPGHRFWHITRKPKFKVDPRKGGFHAIGLGGQTTWLWVAPEDYLYNWHVHPYLSRRKLAAEIDVQGASYSCFTTQVGRVSIPGECIVKDPERVRVIGVMPIAEALAEADAHKRLTSAWIDKHYEAVKGPRGYRLVWASTGNPVTREDREYIDRSAHGPGYEGLVRANPPGDWQFAWHCPQTPEHWPDLDFGLIDYMLDHADEVEPEEFLAEVGAREVERTWWHGHGRTARSTWRESGYDPAADWSMGWYRSQYPDGTPVMFHTASGVEHVWEPRGYKFKANPPSGDELGDCYDSAFNQVAFFFGQFHKDPSARLVHATVIGQGPLEGVPFGHAWVEVDAVFAGPGRQVVRIAVDRANGRDIQIPAESYRRLGQARDVREYTGAEARRLAVESGHYGPWHSPAVERNPTMGQVAKRLAGWTAAGAVADVVTRRIDRWVTAPVTQTAERALTRAASRVTGANPPLPMGDPASFHKAYDEGYFFDPMPGYSVEEDRRPGPCPLCRGMSWEAYEDSHEDMPGLCAGHLWHLDPPRDTGRNPPPFVRYVPRRDIDGRFIVEAFAPDREGPVGLIMLSPNYERAPDGRLVARVGSIQVDHELRRKGVATGLYEAAARAVAEEGMYLASDAHGQQSPNAEAFWAKQERRGRADVVTLPYHFPPGAEVQRHVLRESPPETLANPRSDRWSRNLERALLGGEITQEEFEEAVIRPPLTPAEQFFFRWAGWSSRRGAGPVEALRSRAEGARRLARAEAWAHGHQWTAYWDYDFEQDPDPDETPLRPGERYYTLRVFASPLVDGGGGDGGVPQWYDEDDASLGRIRLLDQQSPYRRVLEARLFEEVLEERGQGSVLDGGASVNPGRHRRR